MLQFTATIKKFDSQGEKTGWTYIEIVQQQANVLNPGVKTSYRVKGKLDAYAVEKIAVIPMGNGAFVLPLNGSLRKAIGKGKGAEVAVCLEPDTSPILIDADFTECLQDEPLALQTFNALTKGHQAYFSKWIQSAKGSATKAKRIAQAINALAKGMGYPEMLRAQKAEKQALGR